jgi:N12 class adenine-specific DNA methylase
MAGDRLTEVVGRPVGSRGVLDAEWREVFRRIAVERGMTQAEIDALGLPAEQTPVLGAPSIGPSDRDAGQPSEPDVSRETEAPPLDIAGFRPASEREQPDLLGGPTRSEDDMALRERARRLVDEGLTEDADIEAIIDAAADRNPSGLEGAAYDAYMDLIAGDAFNDAEIEIARANALRVAHRDVRGAKPPLRADVDAAAAEADTAPTDAQKEAGNYKKGHVRFGGFDILIENAKGSERSGRGADGTEWSVTMPAHYGYIRRTEGADGDHVDVYLGDGAEDGMVVVINQVDAETGQFDEHKAMPGFANAQEAIATYRAGFSDGKGDQRIGSYSTLSLDGFKDWLANGDQTKPLGGRLVPRSPAPAAAQSESAPMYLDVEGRRFPVASIEEASRQFVAVRDQFGEGASNTPPVTIVDPDGNELYRVSYNGRVWPNLGRDWEPGDKPAFDPRAAQSPEAESSAQLPPVSEPALQIRDYSEKSIIVTGQTKENMDRIKGISGVRALWAKKAKGWIFPKTKEQQVREALADLLGEPAAAPRSVSEPEVKPKRKGRLKPGEKKQIAEAELRAKLDDLPTDFQELRRLYEQAISDLDRAVVSQDGTATKTAGRRMDLIYQRAGQLNDQGYDIPGERGSEQLRTALEPDRQDGRHGIFGRAMEVVADDGTPFLWQGQSLYAVDPTKKFPEASGWSSSIGGSLPHDKDRHPTDRSVTQFAKDVFRHRMEYAEMVGRAVLPEKVYRIDPETGSAVEVDAPAPADQQQDGYDQPKPQEAAPAGPESQQASPAPGRPATYGANNKLISRDRADAARRKLREKLQSQVSSGVDPEIMAEGAVLAVFHVEAGARKFSDFARAIVQDLGDAARPFVKLWYNAARDYPGMMSGDMTPYDEVAAADVDALLSEDGDGVQGSVPDGDARAGAADVPGTAQNRGSRRARAADGRGSPEAVPRDRGTEPDAAPAPRGRGNGTQPADRVPGRGERGDAAGPVKGENFTIEIGALGEDRSWRQKALDNIRAIELMREIEAEGRPATRSEQAELARYVGWGGIKGAFPDTDGKFAKGFEKIGARLKELLTDTEYRTAQRSIQYAHYTSETIVRGMWAAAERFGFKGGKVFEPGMGVGNFAGMMPPDLAGATDYAGLELDHTTARIARLLYPRWGVRRDDFTKAPLPEDTFDLVIGNPPFADVAVQSDPRYPQKFLLHDYFFAKSLDAVRPGGLLMFISSAGTMNKIDAGAREYLADRADLVGAVRLPGNAFERNAGTSVTTDIVVLRKRMPDEAPGDRSWTGTTELRLPDKEGKTKAGAVNRYFVDNPAMVLGEEGFFDKLYAGRYAVRAAKGADIEAQISDAFARLPAGVMSDWQDTAERAEVDFGTSERKDGSFYIDDGGRLMQVADGVGQRVQARGKGVKGGRSAAEMERIRALVPIRDALRAVYAADLANDTANAITARARLNESYDAFVAKYGPINKAEYSYRRPTRIQAENARSAAREEARYAGEEFDEGTFDPRRMIEDKASLSAIARARDEAREQAEAAGRPWIEGSFDPAEMDDIVIEKRPNVDPFMDDPESYRLRAIEHYNDADGTGEKGAVFRENVITKDRKPEINSLGDALLYVLNQTGRADIDRIAEETGKTRAEVIDGLGDAIFRVPGTEGTYETREKYLSGNVRKKLRLARAEAMRDPSFQANVIALEAAQPAPIPPSEIGANLGMPWIPTEVIEQFGIESLGLGSLNVRYTPALALWQVDGDTSSLAAVSTFGTEDRSAPDLILAALNRQDPKVYDTIYEDGNKRQVLNPTKTESAAEKVREIKARFTDWLFSDPERAQRLAEQYNEEYNSLVAPEYDGSYLTTPGVSSEWSWRPHQKRVIARIIQDGNTYMAHAVGAGKTSAMIGAGMEMRRLGLVRKPMYVVPNHMLGQFAKEFYEQYPTARIAVADERRFHTDRRKQFIASVANEDLDAVIITHSAFGMIPISEQFEDGLVQDQVDQYRELLVEIGNDQETRITRSRIEKQIERLEQRLTAKGKAPKDQVFTFEEMGVDFLFVDEAHLFRKLDFATKMTSVKGVSPEGSKASWDLFVKTRYLETQTPGRNLVLASGTPVTNTMAELFSVSRYLQMAELEERQLGHFDAWAGAFGDTVTALEQDPAGGYKPVTRFAKFINIPELSVMVRQVMDVVTSKSLAQYVTRPVLKGGKRVMNLAERSPELESFQQGLAARMTAIANRRGPPKPGDDIILSVINDGRHAAIDMRLIGAEHSDAASKLDLMINNVHRIWKETKRQPLHRPSPDGYEAKPFDRGPATQMIFANLGLSASRGFVVPDYIRSELVRRGVPKSQIAMIADFKTHVAKQRLFNDMNEGKVRVLIGSTSKMATGVNAQRRLYAVHNLDPLWYPADDEQRNGRIIRQGNLNPEVEIHDYSTKGTYDSTMWGLMETKARFIQGFFEGDPSVRDMEDLGEASQYEQAKALSTADPRLMTLTELRQDLERAERRKSAFERDVFSVRSRVSTARRDADYARRRIAGIDKDITGRVDTKGDLFKGTVNGNVVTDRLEFGEAVMGEVERLVAQQRELKDQTIAEIGGFTLVADVYAYKKEWKPSLSVERADGFENGVDIGGSVRGMVQSIESVGRGLEAERVRFEESLARAEADIADFSPQMERVFEGQDEIDRLREQVRSLEAALAAETKQAEAAAQAQAEAEATEAVDDDGPRYSFADDAGLFRRRSQGVPKAAAETVHTFTKDADIKAHARYREAKAGDWQAAVAVVDDLVPDVDLQRARERFGTDVVYVPVIAEEASGRNKLPNALAELYAQATGAAVEPSAITQVNRAFHTGARPMDRLISRPIFAGPVEPGRRYVLVDDVTVMGGTLAELADYIQANGGEVAGVVNLVNAGRSGYLKASKSRITMLERRFGDAIRNELNVEPGALTADEATYLANFRDADALRDGVAKARVARRARLDALGVSASAAADSVTGGLFARGPGAAESADEQAVFSHDGTTYTWTPELLEQAQELAEFLRAQVQQMNPTAQVVVVDKLVQERTGLTGLGVSVDGLPRIGRSVVVAMRYVDEAGNVRANPSPGDTLNHEILHDLRRQELFTEEEESVLFGPSDRNRLWQSSFNIESDYGGESDAVRREEAAAMAWEAWKSGRLRVAGRVRRAFQKIDRLLRSLANWLAGRGFTAKQRPFLDRPAEEVFERIASGEVGRREPQRAERDRNQMYSIPPDARQDAAGTDVREPGARAARESLMKKLVGVQPIDRAMRVPFQIFGGLDDQGQWRPGRFLSEQAGNLITNAEFSDDGRMAWMNTVLRKARSGLVDRHGLDPEYVDRDRERALEERAITAEIPEIMQVLRNNDIGADEARVLQAVLTGQELPDGAMERISEPIRNAIDTMGQEAVQLGLLSPEAFERNRGTYLHRVYLKHEIQEGALARWVAKMAGGRRRKILGNQFKGRGMFVEVPYERLMKDMPDLLEGGAAPAKGAPFRILDRVSDSGKVVKRVYLEAGREVPAEFESYSDKGLWEVRGTRGNNIILWRDFTKAEREQMGEIVDARYTIAKTYMGMAHDLSTGRFYRDIADNSEWSTGTEPPAEKWRGAQEYNRFWADPEIEWVQVPDGNIPKTRTKRYGALAGRWVRAEIWRDLAEVERMQTPAWWDALITNWKLNKTARNPVVHMNNVMSNAILMDLADVRAVDFVDAVRAMVTKNADYRDAVEHGAFGADMMSVEIRDNVLKPLLEEIGRDMLNGRGLLEPSMGVVGKFFDRLWRSAKYLDRKMIDAYRFEDEIFRMATYIRRRHTGMDAPTAAREAREQFLDYDIRAPWVNAARRTVLPFISYTYRAVPVVAKSVAARP